MKMTINEAIAILREHNTTGASVMQITKGKALENDLLTQVLDRCEQNEAELAEVKRLLRLAVEDIHFAYFCFQAACKNVKCEFRCPYYNKDTKACSMGWRYYKEAERFIK